MYTKLVNVYYIDIINVHNTIEPIHDGQPGVGRMYIYLKHMVSKGSFEALKYVN